MSDTVWSYRLFMAEDAQDRQSWAYLDYDKATSRAVAVRMLNQTLDPLTVIIRREGEEDMQMACPPLSEGNQPVDFPVTVTAGRVSGFSYLAAIGISG